MSHSVRREHADFISNPARVIDISFNRGSLRSPGSTAVRVRVAFNVKFGEQHNDCTSSTRTPGPQPYSPNSVSSFSSFSTRYHGDSLLEQLKFTKAKNKLLQGKLRDIEKLVDCNYDFVNAQFSKLMRQQSLLERKLIVAKKRLLHFRVASQSKSARITRLKSDLSRVHHMLVRSPSLPLLLHPVAPPRIPREGYAMLLIVIALLQAVVWGLVLLAGVMYLGMLELRFRVDILRDGGLFDQLFLFKGVTSIVNFF